MKSKNSIVLLLLFVLSILTACQGSETVEEQDIKIYAETCEIVESSEAFCEKPVKLGIYTEYYNYSGFLFYRTAT